MGLSARLKGRTHDAKLLRRLFESRMKSRMALTLSARTVEQVKKNAEEGKEENGNLELLTRTINFDGTGEEDTSLHNETIDEICNKETNVEVLLTHYLI